VVNVWNPEYSITRTIISVPNMLNYTVYVKFLCCNPYLISAGHAIDIDQ